jgi:hypothetical protein
MKRAAKLARPHPKLPKVPQEMQQWSELLLTEILDWENVSTRPMFGMSAVYRGSAIFGVLPRSRAMDTPYSVSFKLKQPAGHALRADPRIIVPEGKEQGWISFELQSGQDIANALHWFRQAYDQATRVPAASRATRRSRAGY